MKRDYKLFLKDYTLVWDAIQIEIPNLKPKLQELLAELEEEGKTEND